MKQIKKRNIGVTIVCSMCFAIGIAAFVFMSVMTSKYDATYAQNDLEIGNLNMALSSLSDEVATMDSVEVVEVKLKSCSELGNRVAALQTNYQYLPLTVDNDTAWMDNVNTLDVCFDVNGKNSRVPWYASMNPDVHFTWSFQTTYGFSGLQVPVLWLCYDNMTQDLLAYAMSVYDTETGLFSNVSYYMTSLGAKYYYENPSGVNPDEEFVPDDDTDDDLISDDYVDDMPSDIEMGIGSGGAPEGDPTVDDSNDVPSYTMPTMPDHITDTDIPADEDDGYSYDDWWRENYGDL